MSFFGLMTVKAHREQIGHYQGLADARRMVIGDRDVTIGRLQRENAKLLTELSDLKAKRARSNGNLIPGGPKKKAAALAERAGSVG